MTDTKGLRAQPRPDVAALAPYVPGRPAEEVKRLYGLADVVKLASNENPFGPSPRAVEAAARALAGVNSYPDGAAVALRERLAARFGLARENVAVGNGSDEVILLLALAYVAPGDEAVLAAPPYSIHRTAVLVAGGAPIGVPLRDHVHDLEAMAAAVTARTKLIFVANPHNPTGTAVDAGALRRFAAAVPPDVLVTVDEAYHDFADDALRHSARDLLDERPNVVTLRTFSKAYGLAGLRAGYALAHRDVVAALDRIRPPFGLNAVAQAAALAALDDAEYVARVVAETRAGRARLLEIARRHGLDAIPSQANFVLMKVSDSPGVTGALLRRGVIVRPGENLGVPGWVRVSVGTAEEIDRFEAALDAVRRTMAAQPKGTCRVTADRQSAYPEPLIIAAGEEVTVGKNDTTWSSFVWCTNNHGKSGWVPEGYLERTGTTGTLLRDYDATELSVQVGEELTIHDEAGGWFWCTNQRGQSGWVPREYVDCG